MTNIELIKNIYKLLTKKNDKPNIKFIEDRFGHDKRYSLNVNKLKKYFKKSILKKRGLKDIIIPSNV